MYIVLKIILLKIYIYIFYFLLILGQVIFKNILLWIYGKNCLVLFLIFINLYILLKYI